jgi:oxygen-dependent protoporphyrinogen oxidase
MMGLHIAVVGAGLSGLATAFRLRRSLPSVRLTIYEASDRPGGHIGTLERDGFRVELGPNGFLSNRTEMVELCRDLGLENRLEKADEASNERFVFLGDRLRRLPKTPGEFLRSDVLSWRGKLRFLMERFFGRPGPGDESIADFGRRHFGREATDSLLDAVVTGIFAGDYEKLSLSACFPKLAELERQYGSLLKAQATRARERHKTGEPRTGAFGGVLTAPVGGMGVIVEELTKRLADAIEYNRPVARIVRRNSNSWRIEFVDAASEEFDAVVVAAPSRKQAQMLVDQPELAAELAAIHFAPAVVVAAGYRRAELPTEPRGFGHIAPERLGRPVLGVIWSSSIFPDQAPQDAFLFRAILGGDRRRDVLDWDDDRLIQAVRDELRATLRIETPPTYTFVKRWPHAIPQYRVGHLARMARIRDLEARLPGMFLTGYSFAGVGVGDCARESSRTAQRVEEYLLSRKSVSGGE